jgi:hypothetical protein
MKKFLTLSVLLSVLFVNVGFAETRVSGYTKKNGTYVNSYYRSDSNSKKSDNYSSYGNTNPYTGKKGYLKY